MTAGRAILLAVVLSMVSTSGPSRAEPPAATKKHAQDLFARGVSLSKQNRWRNALAAFEESAGLYPHPRTTFNMGYCERGLGHFTRARKHFRQAVAMDAATPDKSELSPEMRDAASRYLRDAEASIGRVALTLPELGAKLSIDGRPVERLEDGHGVAGTREPGPPEPSPGLTWTIDADAGSHVVVVVAADGRRSRSEVLVVATETVTVTIELPTGTRETPPQHDPMRQPPPAPTPPTDVTRDDTLQLVGAGIVGGIGAAGIVAGVVFLARALSLHADAAEACPDDPFCPDDRAFELANEARQAGNGATASFVVGGAGILCAGFLLLSAPSVGLFEEGLSLHPSPGGLRVRAQF